MVDWKIYYGDGSTFSSDDGCWRDAPAGDVQLVAQTNADHGVEYVRGGDFYVMRNGCWFGLDQIGFFDHLLNMGLLKIGRMLTREEYDAVVQRAYADLDFPVKTAAYRGELQKGRTSKTLRELQDCGCREDG